MIGFSIIICCYNSSLRIKSTLLYISRLLVRSNYKVEVLIVDNMSNDDTVLMAKNSWELLKSPFNLRVVKEVSKGLTNARICGIINSTYDYLILCDDDNYLFPNYLIEIEKSFSSHSCDVIGGKGIAVSKNKLPDWFFEYGQSAFAVGDFGRNEGFGYLSYGAGLVIKRKIALKYAELKKELFLMDRNGNKLLSGGDSELCFIIGLDKVYYNPRLNFYHNLYSRVSESYLLKLNRGFGYSEAYLTYYRLCQLPTGKAFIKCLKILFNSIVVFVSILFKRDKNLLLKVKFVYNFYFSVNLFFSILFFSVYLKKASNNINFVNSP